ncbi:hypothetical protein D3C75_713460 [compost metagenome]
MFDSSLSIAARTRGEQPYGFSLEASLMTSSRPSSRFTSSIGLPGWYTGRFTIWGLGNMCLFPPSFTIIHLKHNYDLPDFNCATKS